MGKPHRNSTVRHHRLLRLLAPLAVMLLLALGGYFTLNPVKAATDPIIMAAGDVACSPTDANWNGGNGNALGCGQKATATLIKATAPNYVFALGDTQYDAATAADYAASYNPTWGQFKAITYPVIGNHEYKTAGASGYFNYFGDKVTPKQPGCRSNCMGYYGLQIGAWHIIVMNSECANVPGGCAVGSPQEVWLKSSLQNNTSKCTMAVWHEPYWAPTTLNNPAMQPMIQDLYDADADLILTGHDHSYVRYGPQNPAGASDPARGLRQFIIGSGGGELTPVGSNLRNVAASKSSVFGAVKFTLHATSYDWSFMPIAGTTYSDAGTIACH